MAGARVGDRTLLDVLVPVLTRLRKELCGEQPDLIAVLVAARTHAGECAEATAQLAAHAGRSSYVDPKQVQGVPDPGAVAAAELVGAAVTVLLG
jgi:dihydroxyacetone kinase